MRRFGAFSLSICRCCDGIFQGNAIMKTWKIAQYFTSGKKRLLVLSDVSAGYGIDCESVKVADKAEARKIAAERGAKCWNF